MSQDERPGDGAATEPTGHPLRLHGWSDPAVISVALVAGFAILAALQGMPLADVGSHLAAGCLVLAVTFVFLARGWIGGGDAKFASTTALWFGWAHLFDYLLVTSLLGGVLTLVLLEFRRHCLPSALARQDWVVRLHEPAGGVPYGIALAAAALIIYPSTAWMMSAG